jgi:hypothetical protein
MPAQDTGSLPGICVSVLQHESPRTAAHRADDALLRHVRGAAGTLRGDHVAGGAVAASASSSRQEDTHPDRVPDPRTAHAGTAGPGRAAGRCGAAGTGAGVVRPAGGTSGGQRRLVPHVPRPPRRSAGGRWRSVGPSHRSERGRSLSTWTYPSEKDALHAAAHLVMADLGHDDPVDPVAMDLFADQAHAQVVTRFLELRPDTDLFEVAELVPMRAVQF